MRCGVVSPPMVPDVVLDIGLFVLGLVGLYLLAVFPRKVVERLSGDDVEYEDGVARRRPRPEVDPDDVPAGPVPEGAVRCPHCGTVNEDVAAETYCYECNRQLPSG